MFLKKFEIRWSDLDANRHLANSTYPDLFSETRMSFLRSQGITHRELAKHNFGPILFSEELFYIKEILPNETVTVGLELLGNSPNFKYGKFAHSLFNEKKQLCTYSEVFFGWMDLKARKLIIPPEFLTNTLGSLAKADHYEEIPNDINLKNPKIPFGKTF